MCMQLICFCFFTSKKMFLLQENKDLFDDIGHETDDIPTEHLFFDTSLQTDLFITVTDPKKHVETMETYITYKLSTKVCFYFSIELIFFTLLNFLYSFSCQKCL